MTDQTEREALSLAMSEFADANGQNYEWDDLAGVALAWFARRTPAPAPVDREALVEKVAMKIGDGGMHTWDESLALARAVLDAIEGVSRA